MKAPVEDTGKVVAAVEDTGKAVAAVEDTGKAVAAVEDTGKAVAGDAGAIGNTRVEDPSVGALVAKGGACCRALLLLRVFYKKRMFVPP